ncbi:hypothetical protein Htur_2104 [Haloterrigena turkmenica DSM 5511]|uniref:DUF5518 domain-containing protein n=1 Tax=Haloterrigena turkmenica (strain ATCC 51198 / DSM 5511 / JCM 9101 / NCIMB 13204 / VKM B-1734 / 4k) TaxID=543526 RepID=D2RTN6_HALTV|nr:DUF5518 domain-containing protein [Haloterrigena turkmenica]ADB60987.1 hypothetical protein Htur_2104 [Haloterrigena turkmenica DSM 5511]
MDSDATDTPPPIDTYGTDADARSGSNTVVNALIGGGVGIVLSFLPGSTVLGGGVAGYLEGGGTDEGLRVGALAGLIMLVPKLLIGLFALWFLGILGPGGFGAVIVLFLLGVAAYTLVLSIVGAVIGAVLESEFDRSRPQL